MILPAIQFPELPEIQMSIDIGGNLGVPAGNKTPVSRISKP
jgi:hypothetical protein